MMMQQSEWCHQLCLQRVYASCHNGREPAGQPSVPSGWCPLQAVRSVHHFVAWSLKCLKTSWAVFKVTDSSQLESGTVTVATFSVLREGTWFLFLFPCRVSVCKLKDFNTGNSSSLLNVKLALCLYYSRILYEVKLLPAWTLLLLLCLSIFNVSFILFPFCQLLHFLFSLFLFLLTSIPCCLHLSLFTCLSPCLRDILVHTDRWPLPLTLDQLLGTVVLFLPNFLTWRVWGVEEIHDTNQSWWSQSDQEIFLMSGSNQKE